MEDVENKYRTIIGAIENKRRFGKMNGRDVMRYFLTALHHPEQGMRVIHIAGTNGKGSTAAGLAAVLQAMGYRVGLFTSPHLVDFCERISMNGVPISHERAAELGEAVLSRRFYQEPEKNQAVQKELEGIEDTMFDDSLLMAIFWFREQKCDYVILETGLGGRLDSTSGLALVPELCIITRIGFDHMRILGNTLSAIAGEKAGILTPGTRLVLGKNEPEARDQILQEARELDVEVTEAAPYISLAETIPCGLEGSYQHENMANVLAAVRVLFPERKREDLEQAVRTGLREVRWPGRMQVLSEDPFLLIDGAHNPQGVEALADSLRSLYGPGPYTFVMGVLADKDYHRMIRKILPLALSFRTVTVENARALQGQELAELIRRDGVPAKAYRDVREALKDAFQEAKEKQTKTVAFGSLYFIGEILKLKKSEEI